MFGGLGAYGVITELVIQMTPTSLTTVNTITNTDADLFGDLQRILAVRAWTCVGVSAKSTRNLPKQRVFERLVYKLCEVSAIITILPPSCTG